MQTEHEESPDCDPGYSSSEYSPMHGVAGPTQPLLQPEQHPELDELPGDFR